MKATVVGSPSWSVRLLLPIAFPVPQRMRAETAARFAQLKEEQRQRVANRGGNALEMSAFAGSGRILGPPYHPHTLLIIVSRRAAEMTVQVVSRTVVVVALLMLTVSNWLE